LNERPVQFEWDEIKAAANLRKHGVSFDLESTVFNDPRLLTVADLSLSEIEDRWFSNWLAEHRRDAYHRLPLVRDRSGNNQDSPHLSAPCHKLKFDTPRKIYE
jgi:hypothetical protein